MSSDKTRNSYNPSRHYRQVIAQQGRVTLDADFNSAEQIAIDNLRAETIDIVGPSGTPDDGYAISIAPPFDLTVQAGTMYVGGLRVTLDNTLQYSQQAQGEWLDYAFDPTWVAVDVEGDRHGAELVYLSLQEQEVSAVEDTTLREVALGGPDTTQRMRLLQHIVRTASTATDCDSAWAQQRDAWAKDGLIFDPKTMQLIPTARLQAGVSQPNPPSDECDPTPEGGYLGADNQLIRVQIIENRNSDTGISIAWGYDNASFLYRATIAGSTVTLTTSPVDDSRQPRAGQLVEILPCAVDLQDGDYIAAPAGEFHLIQQAYNPDSMSIGLDSNPSPSFQNAAAGQPSFVFVRIWESYLTVTPGQDTPLIDNSLLTNTNLPQDTGLTINLTSADNNFQAGTFWSFAVRPLQPTQIFPEDYQDAPQLPEGPHRWACPLAFITWQGREATVTDCRDHFENLVDLTRRHEEGCCTVQVTPADLTADRTLQRIVDTVDRAGKQRVTICFKPGVYNLSAPLILDARHAGLTLEGCRDGVIFQVMAGHENLFLFGMIIVYQATGITIRDIRFELPQVSYTAATQKQLQAAGAKADQPKLMYHPALFGGLNLEQTTVAERTLLRDLYVSVGVRVLHCAMLTIEGCLFRFSLTKDANVLGVGIWAASELHGFRLHQNRFLHEEDYLAEIGVSGAPFRTLVGCALVPAVTFDAKLKRNVQTQGQSGSVLNALIDESIVSENTFAGLTMAALILAQIGQITLEDNSVKESYSGFWLISPETYARALLNQDYLAGTGKSGTMYSPYVTSSLLGLAAVIGDPLLITTLTLLQGFQQPMELTLKKWLKVEGESFLSAAAIAQLTDAAALDQMTGTSHIAATPARTITTPEAVGVALNPVQKAIADQHTKNTAHDLTLTAKAMVVLNHASHIMTVQSHKAQFTVQVTGNHIDVSTTKHQSGPDCVILAPNWRTIGARETTPPKSAATTGASDTAASHKPIISTKLTQPINSTLLMNDNQLSTHAFAIPAALIVGVAVCTVTGNLIFNRQATPDAAIDGTLFEEKADSPFPQALEADLRNFSPSLILLPGIVIPYQDNMPAPPDQAERDRLAALGTGRFFAVGVVVSSNVLWGPSSLWTLLRLMPSPFTTWLPMNTHL